LSFSYVVPSTSKSEDSFEELAENSNNGVENSNKTVENSDQVVENSDKTVENSDQVVKNSENVVGDEDDFEILDEGHVITTVESSKGSKLISSTKFGHEYCGPGSGLDLTLWAN
jgi:hypothetical protein